MFGPFKPAPHIAELPAEKIDSTYKRLRWQVFAGIFFGYAAYYFVRANFDLAQPGLIQAGLYSKAELGVIGSAAGLAYGLSKFVMQVCLTVRTLVYSYHWFIAFWSLYDHDGFIPMGNLWRCHHVGNDLLKWLVPRYGLASMWSYNGTLVV